MASPQYSEADKARILEHIFERVSCGHTMTSLCRRMVKREVDGKVVKETINADMPWISTVRGWIRKDPELVRREEEARVLMAGVYHDVAADQFDTKVTKLRTRNDGSMDPAHVAYLTNKAKTLLAIASRHAPKKYGDLLKVVGDNQHDPVQMSDTELMHRLQCYLRKAKKDVPSRN